MGERERILELVREGILSIDEALDLLESVANKESKKSEERDFVSEDIFEKKAEPVETEVEVEPEKEAVEDNSGLTKMPLQKIIKTVDYAKSILDDEEDGREKNNINKPTIEKGIGSEGSASINRDNSTIENERKTAESLSSTLSEIDTEKKSESQNGLDNKKRNILQNGNRNSGVQQRMRNSNIQQNTSKNNIVSNKASNSNVQKQNNKSDENFSVKFPLDEKIYMQDDYIHPSILFKLNRIKEQSESEYEKAKRSVVNNNRRMNKTNSYHKGLVGSNKYHEMEFPVIGVKPDLEEFTEEIVWDDEKFYYHSRAKEYIPYDIPDHYISTSARFGSVNIGNLSKISGKKDAGWGAIQKGEFYITERQLIIFDKGPSKLTSFLNLALNADTYKRSVYWFTWPEIDYVEGNIKEGTLLISTSQDKHKQHKFTKINESNQNIGFTEDELRYLVNLIGSLIEKSLY